MSTEHTASTAPMRAKLLVWAGLVLALMSIVVTLAATDGAAAAPSATPPLAVPAAVNSDPAVFAAPSAVSGQAPAPWDGAYNTSSLPAWRWTQITLDADQSGNFLTSAIDQFPVLIANLFFSIANLFWLVLLGVLRIGLNSGDLLVNVVTPINASIAWLGTHLWIVAPIFWAVALFRVVKDLFSLKIVTALRSLVAFSLMFLALVAVTGQSLKALSTTNKYDQLNTVATMPWLAQTVSDIAISAVTPMTGLVVRASNGPDASRDLQKERRTDDIITNADAVEEQGILVKSQGATPTCDEYISTMEDTYLDGPESNNAMVIVSRLWQNTLYNSWTVAQFGMPQGSQNLPGRGMCHYAEITNDEDSVQQFRIAEKAYPDAALGKESLVFGPFYNNDDRRRAVTAWVACEIGEDGNWKTNPAFDGAWGRRAVDGGDGDVFSNELNCHNIMTGEGEHGWYDGYESSILDTASDILGYIPALAAQAASAGLEALTTDPDQDPYNMYGNRSAEAFQSIPEEVNALKAQPASSWAGAASGANGPDRILQSVIALLTAIIFLISFGGVAVGLLFAQLLLIACLMFVLPVAFVLIAVGANKQGVQLIRLTAAAMLAQAAFVLLITALLLLSGLFQSLFLYLTMPFIIGSILYGLAPVAAWFILRKVLQKAGLGDIASMTGALSFATSATLRSSGNPALQAMARPGKNGKSKIAEQLGKTPWLGEKLNKFDQRYAPNRWGSRINPSTTARMRRAQERQQDQREAVSKKANQRVKNAFLAENIAARKNSSFGRLLNMVDRQMMSTSATQRAVQGAGAWAGVVFTAAAPWALGAPLLGIAALAGQGVKNRSKLSTHNWFRDNSRAGNYSNLGRGVPEELRPFMDPVNYSPPSRIPGSSSRDAAQEMHTDALKRAQRASRGAADGSDGMESLATTISDQMAQARGMGAGEVLIDERQTLLAQHFADQTGYAVGSVLTTPGGIAIARPLSREEMATASKEQLKDFQHWMSSAEKERLVKPDGSLETPMDQAARLVVSGIMRGSLSANGEPIDFLAANGIDIENPAVEQELRSFLAGKGSNPKFEQLISSAIDSAMEQRLVNSMYKVVDTQMRKSIDLEVLRADRVTEIAANTEALRPDTEALERQISDLTKSVTKLSASAAKLTEARASGREKDETAAARLHSIAFENFEQLQKDVLEQFANLHGRSMEVSIAAAALSGVSETEVQHLLGELSDQMARDMDKLVNVLEGARSGTVVDPEVQVATVLKELKSTLDKKVDKSYEHVKNVAEHLSNIEDLLNSGQPRRAPEAQQNARQFGEDRQGVPT